MQEKLIICTKDHGVIILSPQSDILIRIISFKLSFKSKPDIIAHFLWNVYSKQSAKSFTPGIIFSTISPENTLRSFREHQSYAQSVHKMRSKNFILLESAVFGYCSYYFFHMSIIQIRRRIKW